jgi:hypothetical protein
MIRKREKRSRQISFLLLFGCLLFAILALIVSMAGRKEFTALHKFGLEIIGPLQTAISKVSLYTGSLAKTAGVEGISPSAYLNSRNRRQGPISLVPYAYN